jgi:hypothetical protein
MKPQAILNEFEAAMQKAARVADLARGRPVVGIIECVRKLISAERQRALHILAAADRALAELTPPGSWNHPQQKSAHACITARRCSTSLDLL